MNDTESDWGRRFCDVVMKGGITSGIVYPSAIVRLAAKYQLRNIGGASAGAIAAAAAAAAEYRRQSTTNEAEKFAGFKRLESLSEELGRRENGSVHARLFHLFLPSRDARPIFSILGRILNLKSRLARLIWGIIALFMAFPLAALTGLALGALCLWVVWQGGAAPAHSISAWQPVFNQLAFYFSFGFTIIFALLLAAALCAWRAFKCFTQVMAAQDFGLCSGMRGVGQENEPMALTEWLYALFQDIAGKAHSAPLTFGDLRKVKFVGVEEQDGIVLRVMTTCLSGGRPYTLPFDNALTSARFFFDPAELARYFPHEVVQWMKNAAHKAAQQATLTQSDDEAALPFAATADALHGDLIALPPADDLPVILGVRLSLSFPILLSALPLYRESFRKIPPAEYVSGPKWQKYMERVLFTDGGVCSNLPVHMFDAPLPVWPTFAINLRSDLQPWESDADRAVRPKRGQGFHGDRYPISTEPNLAALVSFLSAIIATMQNWRDVLQRSAPGSRDRVVTVRHTEQEGGLNLDMQPDAIARMAASGALAADKLLGDFRPEPRPASLNDDWTYHRWVRVRNQLRVLREYLVALRSAHTSLHNAPVITELIAYAKDYVAGSYPMVEKEAHAANVFLDQIAHLMAEIDLLDADFTNGSPKPKGDLRVIPRI